MATRLAPPVDDELRQETLRGTQVEPLESNLTTASEEVALPGTLPESPGGTRKGPPEVSNVAGTETDHGQATPPETEVKA